jgi:hypothetical protein
LDGKNHGQKNAGVSRETPKSWLTRLNELTLLANRIVGTFYRVSIQFGLLLWQGILWSYKAIVQAGTFAGIVYLAWDSLYQTTLSVGMVYSDAATALQNPIALQNKSNLFTIKNIHWLCTLNNLHFEGLVINGGGRINPAPQFANTIEPGRILNVACNSTLNTVGPFQNLPKLIGGNITLDIDYDAEFFGIWTYHRRLVTPFTWVNNIPQPQWVQGDFAR